VANGPGNIVFDGEWACGKKACVEQNPRAGDGCDHMMIRVHSLVRVMNYLKPIFITFCKKILNLGVFIKAQAMHMFRLVG